MFWQKHVLGYTYQTNLNVDKATVWRTVKQEGLSKRASIQEAHTTARANDPPLGLGSPRNIPSLPDFDQLLVAMSSKLELFCQQHVSIGGVVWRSRLSFGVCFLQEPLFEMS